MARTVNAWAFGRLKNNTYQLAVASRLSLAFPIGGLRSPGYALRLADLEAGAEEPRSGPSGAVFDYGLPEGYIGVGRVKQARWPPAFGGRKVRAPLGRTLGNTQEG